MSTTSIPTTTQTTAPTSGVALAPTRATVDILGVAFDVVTLAEALERILALAQSPGGPHLVLTPNSDHLLRAHRDAEFLALCHEGSLVVADGQPVVWASRLLGHPVPERVAGSDLMPLAVVAALRRGLSCFFVGGSPGDAEAAARILATRAGVKGGFACECPPLGFEHDPRYLDALVQRINAAAPDLVCFGLGSPKQERLMQALRPRLSAGVLMAVGVTFSFVAGTVRRAPRWMRRLGLEWLWRLASEPRRLWRRYLDNLVSFPLLVLRAKLGPRT